MFNYGDDVIVTDPDTGEELYGVVKAFHGQLTISTGRGERYISALVSGGYELRLVED